MLDGKIRIADCLVFKHFPSFLETSLGFGLSETNIDLHPHLNHFFEGVFFSSLKVILVSKKQN
jgi:hypothetical protein